jgi:hypothetical protein
MDDLHEIVRKLHEAYMSGRITLEQAETMWEIHNMKAEHISWSFPTHKMITSSFKFTKKENEEFLLGGAL